MSEITVELPEDLKKEVDRVRGINWSEVAKEAIQRELEEIAERRLILAALNKILGKSKLTEKDALRLGDKLKEDVWKRYKSEGW